MNQAEPKGCNFVAAETGEILDTVSGLRCLHSQQDIAMQGTENALFSDGKQLFLTSGNFLTDPEWRSWSLAASWEYSGGRIITACEVQQGSAEGLVLSGDSRYLVLVTGARASASTKKHLTARTQIRALLLTVAGGRTVISEKCVMQFESNDADIQSSSIDGVMIGMDLIGVVLLPSDRKRQGRVGFFESLPQQQSHLEPRWVESPLRQPLFDESQTFGSTGLIWMWGQRPILMTSVIGHAEGSRVLCFDMRSGKKIYDWTSEYFSHWGARLQRTGENELLAVGGGMRDYTMENNAELRMLEFQPGVLAQRHVVREDTLRLLVGRMMYKSD